MATNGWGFVAELDGRALNQLVGKAWGAASEQIDKIPKTFVGTVPIKHGLDFYYDVRVVLGALPAEYAAGLEGQPIHATSFASGARGIDVRIALPVNIDATIQLRFPGEPELHRFREAGEFIHTVISTVWLAEARVTIVDQGTSQERLIIDPASVRLDRIAVLGNAPPESIKAFINRLARLLLPKLIRPAALSVSPVYGELTGLGMEGARADYLVKTLRGDGADVTGSLQGDARFDFSLRTFIAIGLRFGYQDHPAPQTGAIPFRLPAKPEQTVALSVSQWALTYLNMFAVPKLIEKAVKEKIRDKPHRGMMAIDVFNGGGITDSSADGILVITNVYGLSWGGGRFHVRIDAYDIQRGFFGWDDLAPDIHVTAHISFAVRPNPKDYSMPNIESNVDEFHKEESLLEFLTAPFVAFQDFVQGIGAVLQGNWDLALRKGIEFLADFPFVIATVGFFVALFGGIPLKDVPLPQLKFQKGVEVALLMKINPEDFPGGDPFNAATVFFTIG